jgi:hypothetical protein
MGQTPAAKPRWMLVGTLFTVLGLLGLWRTYSFYGHLLHGWDAQFYYAQARSLVFEHDLDITRSMDLLPYKAPFEPDARGYLRAPPRTRDGHILNKYPIGMSLVEAPLIGTGYLLRLAWERTTGAVSAEAPGYGPWEIATTAVGLLLVTVAGLVLLQQLAARILDERWATFATLAAWFGTSLYYYSGVFPFMAHGVAFTLVVLAITLSLRLVERSENTLAHFVSLAAVLGFLFLVRYQQILIVIVLAPWIFRGLARYRGRRLLLAVPVALFGGLCLVQIGCNYLQTGELVLNSYSTVHGNLFKWTDPDFSFVLWSASRGLLWMCPIVLLAIPGCVLGPARRHGLGWVLLAYGVLQVYIIASSNWPEAGDSFASRYWSECSPLVAIGLISLVQVVHQSLRLALAGLGMAAVGWTMILMVLFIRSEIILGMSHAELMSRVRTFLHL